MKSIQCDICKRIVEVETEVQWRDIKWRTCKLTIHSNQYQKGGRSLRIDACEKCAPSLEKVHKEDLAEYLRGIA